MNKLYTKIDVEALKRQREEELKRIPEVVETPTTEEVTEVVEESAETTEIHDESERNNGFAYVSNYTGMLANTDDIYNYIVRGDGIISNGEYISDREEIISFRLQHTKNDEQRIEVIKLLVLNEKWMNIYSSELKSICSGLGIDLEVICSTLGIKLPQSK